MPATDRCPPSALRPRAGHVSSLVALAGCLWLLTACFGGLTGGSGAGTESLDRQFGDMAVLNGNVFLSCSTSCAELAQCGETLDRGPAVLMSVAVPAARTHDWAVPVNTEVTILESREEPVRPLAGGEAFTARYYFVTVPGRGAAWVAGWCVSTQPDPPQG